MIAAGGQDLFVGIAAQSGVSRGAVLVIGTRWAGQRRSTKTLGDSWPMCLFPEGAWSRADITASAEWD